MHTERIPNSNIRLGLLLIAVGALAALDGACGFSIVVSLWPLLLTSAGLGFVGIFLRRGKREPIFLALGVYLTGFSLMALACNFTSWTVMERLWPLFIAFLGVTFLALHAVSGAKRTAYVLLGMLLLSAAGVFMLVLALGRGYWWTALVFVGVSLLAAEKAQDEK